MAVVPSPYILFLLLIQSTFLHALGPQASSDYDTAIPSCARACVNSFVNVHYGSTLCASRSLQCLCSARGATPYTLGEGALQCLAAEKRVGGCSESVASDTAMDTVYHICDGQKNAITPTHSVITASLILPTVSGDYVQFPPVTTTTTSESTSTTSRQTLPTTLITETKPSPTSWSSSGRSSGKTSSTSSESSSNSSAVSGSSTVTSSETSTTQISSTASSTETNSGSTTSSNGAAVPPTGTGTSDDAGAGGGSPSLTKGQIAGISVGAAVAASFAIGAVVLIRCYRRRNRAETPPPEHFHNDQDHHRRMSTFAYLSGGNGSYDVDDRRWDPNPPRPSPGMSQIPHPPPFRHHHDARPNFLSAGRATRTPPPPPGQEIRKVESSESAFSSPRSRRMSKLLPAKPSMAPFLGPSYASPSQLEAGQAYQPTSNLAPAVSQPQQPHPADSGLVSPLEPQNKSQFPIPLRIQIPSEQEAEQTAPDARDSNITQFEEDANPAQDVLQFWKHPSGGARSDAPVYVRDKSGNWVLAESELGAALSPREPKSARSLSSSTSRPLSTSSRLGLAISTGTRSHQQPPVPTVTKSTQSQNVTKIPPPKDRNYSNPHQIPEPLFSRPGPSAVNPAFRIRTDQGSYSYRGSFNAFETSSGSGASSSGESKPPTPPEKSSGLSPVFESPFSMNPGQPVQTRERPSRLASNASTGIAPQPRRPSLNDPPGQPSPTLGDIYHNQHPQPVIQHPAQHQRPAQVSHYTNQPHGVKRPWQNPAMLRTGSPQQQTMRVVEPSPEPESEWPSVRTSRSLTNSKSQHSLSNASGSSQPPRYLPSNPKDKVPSAPYHQPFFSQQLSTSRSYRQPPPAAAAAAAAEALYPGHYPPSCQHYSSQQQPPYPARNLPQLNTQIPSAHYGPPSAGQAQTQAQAQVQDNLPPSPGGSSLLAKRLGTNRAAQMSLGTAAHRSSVQQRWHRNEPNPPPQQQSAPRESSTPSLSSWLPRVTPTRRGRDSYHQIQ
ncbi:unnamed protein product [Clonostachys rhizophaga]|uniref:Extracellular membrane protein CFEM domain-containing protein n=1 Tax=Clonostachys rhizophaga TaxID=160324 RepID=A0A9N9YD68_9HYPO|nr:unnamed protein product [Clonostachys rhizophaga]